MKCFNFFAFYDDLDLNNQKILCLPSIYQFGPPYSTIRWEHKIRTIRGPPVLHNLNGRDDVSWGPGVQVC